MAITGPHPRQLSAQSVAGLRASVSGRVLVPTDAQYANARLVWNGMIEKSPAVIVECASAADVSRAIRTAREQNLPLAVRGGGHNVAGMATCDGGLLLDVGPMKEVEVNPDQQVVAVGGGASLADLDAATQAHGLAVPTGVVSDTGIAGLTLSGGLGYLRRKYGLTCDNLVAADVVLATGEVAHASADEHPDLLWALKGGGGNFGVVTRFWFQSYPLGPDVFHLFVFYPHEDGPLVLRHFRDQADSMPEEMSIIAVPMRVPRDEKFPAAARGRQSVALLGAYVGDPRAGEQAFATWRTVASPLADLSAVRPYLAVQKALDEDYPRRELRYYWKSKYMKELPDEAIATLLSCAAQAPSDLSTIDLWQLGGAIRRHAREDSAFGDRSSPFLLNVESNWANADDDAQNIRWTRATLRAMQPWLRDQAYLNFPGFLEEQEQQTQAAFGENWARLRELKKRYDPDNVFCLNNNISPG